MRQVYNKVPASDYMWRITRSKREFLYNVHHCLASIILDMLGCGGLPYGKKGDES